MKSPVVKRSIVVAGHKTSVSLEEAFWNGMKEISGLRDMTLSELVGEIDSNRQQGNLSSAIRLFVLDYFRSRAVQPVPEVKSESSGRALSAAFFLSYPIMLKCARSPSGRATMTLRPG